MSNNNSPITIYSSSSTNSEDKKASNSSLRQQQLQHASNNYYTTNTPTSSVSYSIQNPRPQSSSGTNEPPEMYQYEYEPNTSSYYSNSQYHQEGRNVQQQYNNQQNVAVEQRYYQPQQQMYHQSTPDSNYNTGTTNVNSTSQIMQQHHHQLQYQEQHPMMEEVVEEEVEVDQQEYYITPTSVQQQDRIHQPHQYQDHSPSHQMIPQSRYAGEGFPVYLPSARQQVQQNPENSYRRANSGEFYPIPGSYMLPQHNVPMADNVVSSPPPVENEVDVYDFSPNVESMETSSSGTSGQYSSQSSVQLPNSYRKMTPPKMPPATTVTTNSEHAKHESRLKMKQVASAVPQFEEEEDEEELELDTSAKTTGPLISPTRRQAQQAQDEKTTVKRTRKQQLPTDSKEAIIVKTPSPRKKNASGTSAEKTAKSTTSKQETIRAVYV